jgi:hypothetical protein
MLRILGFLTYAFACAQLLLLATSQPSKKQLKKAAVWAAVAIAMAIAVWR